MPLYNPLVFYTQVQPGPAAVRLAGRGTGVSDLAAQLAALPSLYITPPCRCAVQVMGEKLSRVNACPSANQDHRRWTWRMTVRLAGGGGQEEG